MLILSPIGRHDAVTGVLTCGLEKECAEFSPIFLVEAGLEFKLQLVSAPGHTEV
jgi:hypothetical protein